MARSWSSVTFHPASLATAFSCSTTFSILACPLSAFMNSRAQTTNLSAHAASCRSLSATLLGTFGKTNLPSRKPPIEISRSTALKIMFSMFFPSFQKSDFLTEVQGDPARAGLQFSPRGSAGAAAYLHNGINARLYVPLAGRVRARPRPDIQICRRNADFERNSPRFRCLRFRGRGLPCISRAQPLVYLGRNVPHSAIEVFSRARLVCIVPVYGQVAPVLVVHAVSLLG